MSGLLDKAKSATSDEKTTTKPKSDKAPSLITKAKSTNPDATTIVAQQDGPDIPMILNIVGWVVIFIGALLSLQGGSWGLIVVVLVLIVGIGALVQSQRMSQRVSTPKMALSIALALIIATGPYIALVLIPTNSNIVVTEITMDEEQDTISFVVRGSFDSVSAEIVHDGEVLWSESGDTKSEKVTFIVPISDIFVTNAMDYRGPTNGVLEEYIINAESSDGQVSSATINPSYLTREVKDAAVKINQIDKPNQDGIVEVVGLQVEISLGLLNPSQSNSAGGQHDAVYAYPVSADYTVDVRIYKSSSNTLWQHDSQIVVNGYSASWTCLASGSGSKSGLTQQTWLGLCGTVDDPGAEYIEKEDFYDDDGCYTFEVTITNELYADQPVRVIDSNSWELEWDDRGTDSSLSTC